MLMIKHYMACSVIMVFRVKIMRICKYFTIYNWIVYTHKGKNIIYVIIVKNMIFYD